MNQLYLDSLKLKTFTEQDALDYCQLNNINSLKIIELFLSFNELTDISGIKIFKNLKALYLTQNRLRDISVLKDLKNLKELSLKNNQIKDISYIQNLKELRFLNINNLKLESDQIQYINSLNNLEKLWCYNGFKDMNILNQLNKNIEIIK